MAQQASAVTRGHLCQHRRGIILLGPAAMLLNKYANKRTNSWGFSKGQQRIRAAIAEPSFLGIDCYAAQKVWKCWSKEAQMTSSGARMSTHSGKVQHTLIWWTVYHCVSNV